MAVVGVGGPAPGGRPRAVGALCLSIALAAAGTAGAQISPGELSAAHAELDTSGDCLRCHAQRKRVDPRLCLECHDLLAERIDAGEGLHARAEYEECASCHIEHHGREFELIWWGEAGEAAFDHELAGYSLDGAHARASCRDCHRPESISARAELESRRKDLARTFLGLEGRCLGCHRDEHRGQTAAADCLSCHTMEAWLPVALFDHDRTRFRLIGRHRDLGCTECHETVAAPDEPGESYLRFAVAVFASCGDCHQDPHRGRLGHGCAECHTTDGWRLTDRNAFDHDRTRFRLLGRHRELSCGACHPPGRSMRVARFERCNDCHEDYHLGQFAGRPEGEGQCESCHEVRGFRPSTFVLEEHQTSDYPLEGAHLAVPCDACHQTVAAGELPRAPGAAGLSAAGPFETVRFRFPSTSCTDCHADPHREEVRRLVAASGCESCHSLAGWGRIDFDHDRADFPLEGGHVGPGCDSCHRRGEAPPGEAEIRLSGAPTACAGCHEDPHLGQFAAAGGQVECQSCHGVEDWRVSVFDHQTGSTFPLEGAHRQVECRRCHGLESNGERSFVRYKPLATDCAACHGGDAAADR